MAQRSRKTSTKVPNTWGGRRAGAGRKPGPGPRPVPHRPRPKHAARHPVHIILRSVFQPLRSPLVFPTVRNVIADKNRRHGHRFRIVHFSVQPDHVHLIVEADNREALLTGIRGLSVSMTRKLNLLLGRKGAFWAERWKGQTLKSPQATRDSIACVLGSFRKHEPKSRARLDPYSSAPYFDGFIQFQGALPIQVHPGLVPRALEPPDEVPVSRPESRLLSEGWRRAGLLSADSGPPQP